MKTLDVILATLNKKIIDLKDAFDEYQKTSMTTSTAEAINDFEYLEADIKSIEHEDANIFTALNLYIQKRVDAVTTMSLVAKYCLSHEDFLNKTQKIIAYLEETYNEKSGYSLMYSDCYLNSSLAALNIASKYDFAKLLKAIKDTTNIEIQGVPVANLQMKNALTFKVLASESVDVTKVVKILKKGDFDSITIVLKAVEGAYKMSPTATDSFVNKNKDWLQIDMALNLAAFEAEDWTILDHVNSPIKKKGENVKNLFYENLIKEYSDILKIFKDVQASKTILDLSYITEDFKTLSGSEVSLSHDLSIKESLNISNIPLVVGIEDIVTQNAEDDILKLMGNSNTEAE